MRSIAPVLFAVAALAGCAANEAAPEAATQDLIGGTAAGDRYAAVGALVEDGSETPFCTATLVTKSLIITAQHCLEGGSEEEPAAHEPAKVTFRLGAASSSPVRKVALKRWLPAPDFAKPDHTNYASDVMLAELAAPITDIPFIPVANVSVAQAPIGSTYDLVGFGVRTEDGHGAPEGKREVGSFTLAGTRGNGLEQRFGTRAKFDEHFAALDPEGSADDINDRIWHFGELHEGYEVLAYSDKAESCYSDSGGPLLREVNGKLEVVGVVSSGFPGYKSSCLHLGTVFAVFGPETQKFLRRNGL